VFPATQQARLTEDVTTSNGSTTSALANRFSACNANASAIHARSSVQPAATSPRVPWASTASDMHVPASIYVSSGPSRHPISFRIVAYDLLVLHVACWPDQGPDLWLPPPLDGPPHPWRFEDGGGVPGTRWGDHVMGGAGGGPSPTQVEARGCQGGCQRSTSWIPGWKDRIRTSCLNGTIRAWVEECTQDPRGSIQPSIRRMGCEPWPCPTCPVGWRPVRWELNPKAPSQFQEKGDLKGRPVPSIHGTLDHTLLTIPTAWYAWRFSIQHIHGCSSGVVHILCPRGWSGWPPRWWWWW